jgi:hypothetical protein
MAACARQAELCHTFTIAMGGVRPCSLATLRLTLHLTPAVSTSHQASRQVRAVLRSSSSSMAVMMAGR